jgi:hypothetical protein
MKDYESKIGALASRLKTEVPSTPIQKVEPVRNDFSLKEDEAQLNTWVPKTLLKRMKSHAVEQDISLKEINIKALTFYLDNQSKKEDRVNQ